MQSAKKMMQALDDDPTTTLPMGLKQATRASYFTEWSMYEAFASNFCAKDAIPGKDVPWVAILLWRYMLMRSETCKPSSINSCFSALASFGTAFEHVLPTTKYDGNPLLRRQIVNMKRQIAVMYTMGRGRGKPSTSSTPLGSEGVSLLLSAFAVFDEAAFNRLGRRDRHEINAATMQHGTAMRFGHFLYRQYTVSTLSFGADGTVRLITD